MATTTPNFGWTVPTSTDLVKDGAVAIETLGDSIDASLVDLRGGTTGQVLAKASDAQMDFAWVAASGLNLVTTVNLSASGSFNINNCFSATYDNYLVVFSNLVGSASSFAQFGLRTGSTNATGANYRFAGFYQEYTSTAVVGQANTANTLMDYLEWGTSTTTNSAAVLYISAPFKTTNTNFRFNAEGPVFLAQRSGSHTLANSYESLWFTLGSGTLSGNISIYGLGK